MKKAAREAASTSSVAAAKATSDAAPTLGRVLSGSQRAGALGRRLEDVGQVVVGDRGRIVLPAAIRAELGLITGSRLLLSTDPDGSLRLRPYRAVADAGRGLLSELGSDSIADELVEERRGAAAAEDAGE